MDAFDDPHIYDELDPKERVCFNCRLLDMRKKNGGTVVFWCKRQHRPVTDDRLWKRCEHFIPQPEAFD